MVVLLSGVATASAALLQLQGVADTFKEFSQGIAGGAEDELEQVQPGSRRPSC